MPEFTGLSLGYEGQRLTCYAVDTSKPPPTDETSPQKLPVLMLGESVQTHGEYVDLHRHRLADRMYHLIWKQRLIGWADAYHGYPQYEMKLRQELHRRRTLGTLHERRELSDTTAETPTEAGEGQK